MSSDDRYKVRVVEEMDKDGYMVFEKIIQDKSEFTFYNPDYFASIGFPDAIITVVGKDGKETDENDKIAGGAGYKNPENLTWPFKQFVYLVQPSSSKSLSKSKSESPESRKGIYEKIFHKPSSSRENEEKQVSGSDSKPEKKVDAETHKDDKPLFSGISGFVKKINQMLKPTNPVSISSKKEEEPKNQTDSSDKTPSATLESDSAKTPISEPNPIVAESDNVIKPDHEGTVDSAKNNQEKREDEERHERQNTNLEDGELKVIVKIPVVSNVEELSEASKRSKRIKKELKIEGRRYVIGSREIEMCEKVLEKEGIEGMVEMQKEEKTRGTIMEKYKKLGDILTPKTPKPQ